MILLNVILEKNKVFAQHIGFLKPRYVIEETKKVLLELAL